MMHDPLDRIMIRGKLDALIPLPDGAVIIDYKTDQISPQMTALRAENYRAQVQAYREAMVKISGMKVAKVILAFLWPRVLFTA